MPYGAETWALTTQALSKLAAAQTEMEMSVLNITYQDTKTNIIWVKEKTNVSDVIEQVRRRTWIWAGHVNRIRNNRWTGNHTKGKDLEEDRETLRDELDDY